ncbi:MAG: hypothetical protein EOP40_13810 [Rubrivivax sp.]|nr:MAG: hypothetical protein EOP40_13810 [Rubrivivax sp.]
MPTALHGSAQPVPLGGGYALLAPGLRGTAEVLPPGPIVARSRAPALHASIGLASLDAALRNEDVSEVKLIDLSLQRDPALMAAGSVLRSAQGGADLVLEVPDLGPNVGQLVLSIDDAGAVRWHLPQPLPSAVMAARSAGARGAGGTLRFVIPAEVIVPRVPSTGPTTQRSLLGAATRRLLKVLVYPLVDPVIGAVSEHFASKWEQGKRPHRLRSFTPANQGQAGVPAMTPAEVAAMASGGPVLMLIHGTFSTAQAGFGDLPQATLQALHQRYEGRVLAFDHPTLATSPDDNARWLLSQLPSASVQMDIISHSRGGLVARMLAEQQAALGPDAQRAKVRRVVLAGVPNQGTALADPDHMVDMIDRFTTALTLFPTGPATETFEALVTVLKVIGHGALGESGLRGLSSMRPQGPFLAKLNQGGGERAGYFALAADYEPTDRGLRSLIAASADHLADKVFGDASNDLVVPTDGVWGENGAPGFPLPPDRVLSFGREQGVMHTDFFRQPAVADKLLAWLA